MGSSELFSLGFEEKNISSSVFAAGFRHGLFAKRFLVF
jgi:hypothetical protein